MRKNVRRIPSAEEVEMAQSLLFVGSTFPGGVVEHLDFYSKRSLLDCDIVVFEPPQDVYSTHKYKGKSSLGENESFRFREACDHWRGEIAECLAAGKTVIVFLESFNDFYIDTGRREYSGTGRNQKTTTIVELSDNYCWLPVPIAGRTPASGKSIKPGRNVGILRDYWAKFGELLTYNLYFDDPDIDPALVTKTGSKAVAGVVRTVSGGSLVLVPPIEWEWEEFSVFDEKLDEEVWTARASEIGHSLLSSLLAIDQGVRGSNEETPPPEWSLSDTYALARERELRTEIAAIGSQIEALRETSIVKREEVHEATRLRGLLYASGKDLEAALTLALRILGFEASGFDDGESEFDIVFESPEGRFLGEAEGKDSRSINVDKLRQLEMNIQEDFERDEVLDYATGVLFGNAFRLTDPYERDATFFTAKCLTGAKRSGVVLVRTVDLFAPARFVAENSKSKTYAKSVRAAIAKSAGQVARIPHPPVLAAPVEDVVVDA